MNKNALVPLGRYDWGTAREVPSADFPPRILDPGSLTTCRQRLSELDPQVGRSSNITAIGLSTIVSAMENYSVLPEVTNYGGKYFQASASAPRNIQYSMFRAELEGVIGAITGDKITNLSNVDIGFTPGYQSLLYFAFGKPTHYTGGIDTFASMHQYDQDLCQPVIAVPVPPYDQELQNFAMTVISHELQMIQSINALSSGWTSDESVASAGHSLGEIQRLIDKKKNLGVDAWTLVYMLAYMTEVIKHNLDRHGAWSVQYKERFTSSYWKTTKELRLRG